MCGVNIVNPPVKGQLPINGQPKTPAGETGLAVTEIWSGRPDIADLREALVAGDYIVAMNGRPTADAKEFVKVRGELMADENALVGERFLLTVRRGKDLRTVPAPLVSEVRQSEFDWRDCALSLRRNGFPAVFSHDAGTPASECGGPVVNLRGEIVGINIARGDPVQSLTIPAGIVKEVVAKLRQQ